MDKTEVGKCQFSIIPLLDMVAVLQIVGQEATDRPDVAHAAEARAKELSAVIDGIMDIWDDIHKLETFPADYTNRHLTSSQRKDSGESPRLVDESLPMARSMPPLALEIPSLLVVRETQQDVPEIDWVKSS